MNDYPKIQQFRIWSPEEGKYHYSGGTPSMLSSFFSHTATLHTVHKMPYERSTFLTDKNGKEIYEGDILSVDWNDKRYPKHNIGPVVWDNEESCFALGEGGSPQNDAAVYMEVVGNIYENPELP